MPRTTRRGFVSAALGAAGLGLAGATSGCTGARIVDSSFLPTPDAPLTPTSRFYVNLCCGVPAALPRDAWRLELKGLFAEPRALGFGDLTRYEVVTRPITLECIGNSPGGGLISSADFTGVRLADVVSAAGISPHARGLYFEGRDGYPSFLPAGAGADPRSLLVFAMNGDPLPDEHGGPVRVLFPGRYGMKSVKWLRAITATRTWGNHGALGGLASFVDGGAALKSRIDPLLGTPRAGHDFELRGVALSPGRGVSRVELSFDGGEWTPAELNFNGPSAPISGDLWTLWRASWRPSSPGESLIRVRAFDGDGNAQRDDPRFIYDAGAIHTLRAPVV